MIRAWAMAISMLVAGLAGCAVTTGGRPQVHVQLNDGQVLVGELTTRGFTLKTDFGDLRFSADDAGEIGPLEGGDMQQSDELIKLWLRNGSEFVGGWQKPVVHMLLSVGGREVSVDVSIDKLARLQFMGRPAWPERAVFRVLTHRGDDFYVDAATSRVRLDSEIGELAPFLSEISSLTRRAAGGDETDNADNAWRVVLKNGSIIHASMQPDGLDLRPAMGPDEIQVAWTAISRMELARTAAHRQAEAEAVPVAADSRSGYYDNAAQKAVKQAEEATW